MATEAVDSAKKGNIAQIGFSSDQVEQFRRDGYVIARGLAGNDIIQEMRLATLDGLGREIEPIEYEAELQYPGAPCSFEAAGGSTVRRLKQAHSRGVVFTDWLSREELVERLKQLLGSRVVMPLAHHNCIMTKQPRFSSDTGWHQDIRYWSFTRPELVSVWLALGSECRENGCLKLIPGSHLLGNEGSRLDGDLFLRQERPENRELLDRQISAELEAGDVLFFHCRTFHAADRNRSTEPKFSVVFTFRPDDNPPIPGTRSASLPELIIG